MFILALDKVNNNYVIVLLLNFCSIHPHPYNNASPQMRRTHHRQMKDRSQHVNNHQHHVQIEELPDDYDDGANNSRQ